MSSKQIMKKVMVPVMNDVKSEKIALRARVASHASSLRRGMGLTQREVAEKLGIPFTTYRGYENCKSDIPFYLLIELADLYEVSIEAFI